MNDNINGRYRQLNLPMRKDNPMRLRRESQNDEEF
jgi:hypothetical protein